MVQTGHVRRFLKVSFALAICVAMYLMIHPILWPFVWIPIAAAVAWRGDWEARVVALSASISIAVERAAPRIGLLPHLYDTDQARTGVLMIDGLVCAIVLGVALKSRAWWPSWAAAFSALVVVSHLIFITQADRIQPWAYLSSVVIFSWFEYILLAFVAFDLCVSPKPTPPPKTSTVAVLLLGLLICLVFLPLPKQVEPNLYISLQLGWLLIVTGTFALLSPRRRTV